MRIEGPVELLSESENIEYFHMRPKRSQLAAAASDQSQVIDSRDSLILKYSQLEQAHADAPLIPKPKDWGGVRVRAEYFEFWQGQTSRLHDRIVFRLRNTSKSGPSSSDNSSSSGDATDDMWHMERLQP